MRHSFSDIIIRWYAHHKRDLPWRTTKNPYRVWLSEIILQQTRVAQGLPYFRAFTSQFPTVQDLANASEQEVLKLWQGLGYYSRARNLHTTAQYIVAELNGVFPRTYQELLQLKGVGDYTASAIASFCYNEVTATVDGNVYRVLARFFGITTPVNSALAKKEFKQLAQTLIDVSRPAVFNQAIMEFGALQCTPQLPDCDSCPLSHACVALQQNKVNLLPKKDRKIKIRKRYFNYLVLLTDAGETVMQQRIGKGIWQNLYEFPLIETPDEIQVKELLQEPSFVKFVNGQDFSIQLLNPKTTVHKLSHQHLYIKFWLIKLQKWEGNTISWKQALHLPSPIVIHTFIENFKKN